MTHTARALSRAPANFSWIDEGKLAAFGYPSSTPNLNFLLANNITCLVTLSPELLPPVQSSPSINHFIIRIQEFDPPTNLQIREFIEICEDALKLEKAVGVHCRMGRGRTGTMIACYLVKFHKMSPQNAMGRIRKLRPGSIETYSQEEAVMEYYYALCKENYSSETKKNINS